MSVTHCYEHGVLFSTVNKFAFWSLLSSAVCWPIQRVSPFYTHVALLYDGDVYETSLHTGPSIAHFDDVDVRYCTFVPLPELAYVDVDEYSHALYMLTQTNVRVCTNLVARALNEAGMQIQSNLTPDQLYAALTLLQPMETLLIVFNDFVDLPGMFVVLPSHRHYDDFARLDRYVCNVNDDDYTIRDMQLLCVLSNVTYHEGDVEKLNATDEERLAFDVPSINACFYTGDVVIQAPVRVINCGFAH